MLGQICNGDAGSHLVTAYATSMLQIRIYVGFRTTPPHTEDADANEMAPQALSHRYGCLLRAYYNWRMSKCFERHER